MTVTATGALPTAIVIGAMKAGTSAVHEYLATHPEISMSSPKELNFFFGDHDPATDTTRTSGGNWHRGLGWYAGHFCALQRIRGESSPGYTSPAHPGVAARMHATIPDARLIYLVRDPLARAVSQYRHHRRDGTERRPLADALLNPFSQYLTRSRYHDRLRPFLAVFRPSQVTIVVAEELAGNPRGVLRRVFGHVGADDTFWDEDLARRRHVGDGETPEVPRRVADAFRAAVDDDVLALQELAGRSVAGWR